MANQSPEATIALMRKLQIFAPALMLVIAGLVFALWDSDQKNLVAGVIAFLSIPDFFMFKFMADRMESAK